MVPCPNESTIQAFVAGELRAADCAGIEAHIDTCAECRRLLAEVGRALAVSAPPVVTSRATEDTPATLEVLGSQVGRYTLLEAIGAGAMGVVYAARDPDLDRKIAIKLVRGGGVGSGDASARMQREAKAIAKLSHPHVVAIYDVGTFRGDVFIAMELADGGTLRDVLARHAVPWRDVLGYYLQAGRGLAAAHEVGIVHRDFKPDNVLFGKDGRVRVGDFGLALDAGSEDRRDVSARVRSLEATATQTGTVLGTPAYMAPEQMRGERTDARADVFAFSVSVWEGLYGARPFEGASFAELRANVEAGQVRAAPAGTGVPEALRTCLLKGISAHAEERWGSMSELLAALEAAPVPPRRRSRRALALGAFAAIVVMGASRRRRRRP